MDTKDKLIEILIKHYGTFGAVPASFWDDLLHWYNTYSRHQPTVEREAVEQVLIRHREKWHRERHACDCVTGEIVYDILALLRGEPKRWCEHATWNGKTWRFQFCNLAVYSDSDDIRFCPMCATPRPEP